MNTDASKFSLESATSVIKPHVKYLPFKRLGDYVSDLGLREKVDGLYYCLKLWDTNTRLSASMGLECKAFRIEIGSETIIPTGRTRPMRFEYDYLIILCPTNDVLEWAYQRSKFIAESGMSVNFNGTSEIWWVNDHNFRGLARDPQDLSEKVWRAVMGWAMQSIADREKANESLGKLRNFCSQVVISRGV
jgi:hypothetical protein